MKKAFLFLITVLLLFTGCAPASEVKEAKINIISSVFPYYDFALNVVQGADVSVSMLLPPGAESHSFEPTPKDIIDLQNCDLFIYTGGESDVWIEKILDSMDTPPKTLKLMEYAELLHEETSEGMEADHTHEHDDHELGEECEHDHDHGTDEYDEHIWTSPLNAVNITEALCEALCACDGENEALYRENTLKYTENLLSLHESFKQMTEGKNITMIFGDRFPFLYFAKEYGINYYAAFPGCSSHTDANASTIAFLIDKARETKAEYIFHMEFSNHLTADVIAEEADCKTCLFHSCHNLTRAEFERGESYISLMKKNLEMLKKAFSENR